MIILYHIPLDWKPLVLLGESDKKMDAALTGMLKRQGVAVVAANTPKELLNLLDKYKEAIDLVCINGRLASERGGLLISRARTIGRNVRVIVVADRDDDRVNILRYGADEFIQKPLSPDVVAAKIMALIAK